MEDVGRVCRLMSVGTGERSRDEISCERKSKDLGGKSKGVMKSYRYEKQYHIITLPCKQTKLVKIAVTLHMTCQLAWYFR